MEKMITLSFKFDVCSHEYGRFLVDTFTLYPAVTINDVSKHFEHAINTIFVSIKVVDNDDASFMKVKYAIHAVRTPNWSDLVAKPAKKTKWPYINDKFFGGDYFLKNKYINDLWSSK